MMSGVKMNIFISEDDKDEGRKLRCILSGHPIYKVFVIKATTLVTKGGQVLNLGLLLKRISKIFAVAGIGASLQGHKYLCEAITRIIANPELGTCITKLYPVIAVYFSVSSSQVERAIRHAIENGWSSGRADQINNIFDAEIFNQHDRPTNSGFIALVVNLINQEAMLGNFSPLSAENI